MVQSYHTRVSIKGATFRLLRIYLFQLVRGINSDNFSDIHQFNLTFDLFGTFYEVRMTLLYIIQASFIN
jgi:hypothetical protein